MSPKLTDAKQLFIITVSYCNYDRYRIELISFNLGDERVTKW